MTKLDRVERSSVWSPTALPQRKSHLTPTLSPRGGEGEGKVKAEVEVKAEGDGGGAGGGAEV